MEEVKERFVQLSIDIHLRPLSDKEVDEYLECFFHLKKRREKELWNQARMLNLMNLSLQTRDINWACEIKSQYEGR